MSFCNDCSLFDFLLRCFNWSNCSTRLVTIKVVILFITFCNSFLISSSVAPTIAIGSIEASHQEVEEAASIAKAHEFISQLPETYETKVGERGYGLSGGQRQRIALARAIVRNPKILILDDALSAVDASTEEEIRNELQNVMNKMTTLIVTNRVPTIELCDEVLFIEDGKIRAQGKHEDILNEVKSYRSLFLEQEKASKLNWKIKHFLDHWNLSQRLGTNSL